MNTAQFERIEAYLQNRLSEVERRDFEAEIHENSTLRAEVEAQQKLRLGLRALGIEKQLLNAQKRTQTRQIGQIRNMFWGKMQWQTWVAAASIVLVLGVSWWVWNYNSTQNKNQFMALAEKEMTDIQYKSLPFESLQNLSKSAPTRNAREKAEWYVALVYVKKGDTISAKKILRRISQNRLHPYRYKAKDLLEKI
jgi:hypothetical protein